MGFDPSEFQWEDGKSPLKPDMYVSVLKHKRSGYFFVFDYSATGHSALYSPGSDARVARRPTHTWPSQLSCVIEWLKHLKREIEAPDLWGAVAQERKLAEAASSSETPNSAFTPEEQQSLTAKIHEIEKYVIETHSLTGEQAEFVKRRLDYLVDSAKRLGRLDWANVTQSVLITIVLQTAIPPDATRELLRLAWTLLGSFFGATPPLPLGA